MERKASWEQGTRTEEWSGGQWRKEGEYYSGLNAPLVATRKTDRQKKVADGSEATYTHISGMIKAAN